MEFWKMNGAGNDFILIDNRKEKLAESSLPQLARTLCERRLSIGADGLMVLEHPIKDGDIRMLFYNSDGSLGEMCGNGARCLARYAFETGASGKVQRLETTAGLVLGERVDERQYRVHLNLPSVLTPFAPVTTAGQMVSCAYVELGDPGIPHAVVPIRNLADYPEDALFQLGRALRYHPSFPKGANVNFYEIIGDDLILEKTYERGVEDFTYACGTGTGSVVSVLTLAGQVSGQNVRVRMKGGELTVDAAVRDRAICDLALTGPTNIVAVGTVRDEELAL